MCNLQHRITCHPQAIHQRRPVEVQKHPGSILIPVSKHSALGSLLHGHVCETQWCSSHLTCRLSARGGRWHEQWYNHPQWHEVYICSVSFYFCIIHATSRS
mmetsp:Transcript_60434/g.99877  ORF Transcript_60434/g.99877 Transcript_60434/m.99877 type:complete len:101 (+) Transcript_60434:760-1062(+)